MSMPTCTFGRTGPTVSRLGLGLAALGRPGYITLGRSDDLGQDRSVEALQSRTEAVLDAAFALGVTYFDAARSYGRAEDFLARWMGRHELGPGKVTVGSKWGYEYTADWQVTAAAHEVKALTLERLTSQLYESRALLGPHLSLYQIHSATVESGVLGRTDVLARLGDLRDEGMMVGLSVSGPGQAGTINEARKVTVRGRPLFGCVQATWNLLERSAGEALAAVHADGWAVIVKEGVANGLLTDRDGGGAFQTQRMIVREWAHTMGLTTDALALAAVLAQPWADVVLSGAATVEQLKSNARALTIAPTSDVFLALESLAQDPAAYWTARAALQWN